MELEQIDCPVCGPSQTSLWLDDHKPTRYLRCKKCATVFASPRLAQKVRHSSVEIAWDYSADLLAREALRLPALKQEAEYIQKHVQGGRLLDVGCSAGDFFKFFPPSAWERYGVELSASAAEYSARTHKARVMAGTLRSANWPVKYFDVISMIDMFYYMDDPRADLAEVRRILKPNGMVAIEITGQAYMFFRSRGPVALLMDGRWCRLSSDSHLYWFKPAGLKQLLENNGFQPVAWYVLPSPVRSDRFSDFVSYAYYRLFSALAGRSMSVMNWAPKYLCLARPIGHS